MRNTLCWFIAHFALYYVALLITVVSFGIIASRKKISGLIKAGRTEVFTILLLSVMTWAVTQFFVFHTHNVYYDEYRHIQMGEVLADSGLYGVVENSKGEVVPDPSSIKWPPAFHTLLAFLFLIAGPSEKVAYFLNPILAAMAVLAAWLFVRMLSFGPRPALLSITLFAAWPLLLRMAGGVSLEVGAAGAVLLSSALLIAAIRSDSKMLFWTAAAAVGLAGLFRIEAIAVVLIVPAAYFFFKEKEGEGRFSPTIPEFSIALIFLVPAALSALSGFGIYSGFRAQVGRTPFFEGLFFWAGGGLLPYATAALMAFGFIYLLRKKKAIAFSLIATIVFVVLVVTVYVGVNPAKADSQRFQLLCAPALVGLCAAGAMWLEKITRKSKFGFPVVFLVLLLGAAVHMKEAQKPFKPAFEQEYRFILKAGPKFSKEAECFCAIPAQLSSTIGMKAMPSQWLIEPTRFAARDFTKRRIYFRDLRASNPETPGFYQLDREISKKYSMKRLTGIVTDGGPIGFFELHLKEK